MKSRMHIDSREGSRVFASLRQRHMMMELIAGERSLSALARTTGTPLNLAHYHVRRLVALGLVEVVGEEPRQGRAVKLYRAVAESFFVPAELGGSPSDEAQDKRVRMALERAWNAYAGTWYFHDGERGRMRLEPRRRSGTGQLYFRLDLSGSDTAELMEALSALLESYSRRPAADNARAYVAYVALAPDEQ